MKIRTHNVRRRGISTVEFALILPILMAMILGTIEMGTMFYSWLTIQKAAQSRARFAATGIGEEEGTRLTQITEVTQEWLKALDNGNTKEITVSFWPTPAATGRVPPETLVVRVSWWKWKLSMVISRIHLSFRLFCRT